MLVCSERGQPSVLERSRLRVPPGHPERRLFHPGRPPFTQLPRDSEGVGLFHLLLSQVGWPGLGDTAGWCYASTGYRDSNHDSTSNGVLFYTCGK